MEIATKLTTEYRKVNGTLVKVLPETNAVNVFVTNDEGTETASLYDVLAGMQQNIEALEARVAALELKYESDHPTEPES